MTKKAISYEDLSSYSKFYSSDKRSAVLRHALSKSELNNVISSLDAPSNLNFNFSIEVKTMPVTSQKRSGRCWIFSACNVLRESIAKKLGIKDMFEISQNYISYYDKFEKINFVMEGVISLLDEEISSRKNQFLLSSGVGDGGQWGMFVDLVKKYGIVPKSVFPETAQSEMTFPSNKIINASIRKFAYEARKIYNESHNIDSIYELKGEYLQKFYSLLTSCFGVPPAKFDFEYTDSQGKYHIEKDITPKQFFDKYVGDEIDEYVSLINAPTSDKDYYQTYQIELLGNVVGGKGVTHLNIPMERMKELIISQLQNGEIVWFGSDVSNYGDRVCGVWDDKVLDYSSAFDLDVKFDKAAMLDFYHSSMNHAMVITGVDIIEGKPTRWKIENSWGSEAGNKGYYIMSDSFFDLFVYQAAIKEKYLSDDEKKALKGDSILLAPWDPFGTLAD